MSDNIVVTLMEAKMQVNIRSLGNSKGILIPKPILEQTGLQDVAELRVNNGVIEIRPVKTNPREGWAMDSQRIAMDKDDSLVWPEFGNADDKDLKW
jgi:antitoxin MazE